MIKKITDRISAVFTEDGFSSGNCVLVEDTVSLMIDSGAGRALKEARPERINILLNSHHHIDHMGGNDFFPAAVKMAHPLEIEFMQVPEKLSATDAWKELMDQDCFLHAREINGRPNRLYQPWHIDEIMQPGQILECGHTRIRVIHTPGHTAGHCSFHFPEENILFLADICLSKVGPWYGGSDSSVDDFIRSIDAVREMKPEMVVTGHYTDILRENIDAILVEYRDRILKREGRILDYLKDTPSTIHELAGKRFIYPDHPNPFVVYWEKSMIMKHLERLIELGEVTREEGNRFRTTVAASSI